MTIPTEIESHISERARLKASKHAQASVRLISEELQAVTQVAGTEMTVPSPHGGTVTITAAFIEALQEAVRLSSLERFTKEETDQFIKDAADLVESRKKSKSDPK